MVTSRARCAREHDHIWWSRARARDTICDSAREHSHIMWHWACSLYHKSMLNITNCDRRLDLHVGWSWACHMMILSSRAVTYCDRARARETHIVIALTRDRSRIVPTSYMFIVRQNSSRESVGRCHVVSHFIGVARYGSAFMFRQISLEREGISSLLK